ncbi:MAG TPA: chorismate mutase [Anaerolineae bacterium]|nr:chorismate mutase [Anaerolineae bacterium]
MKGNQQHGSVNYGQQVMICRGVRGATTVEENSREAILGAAHELLAALVRANEMQADHVASVYFTTTPDLTAVYPAVAARQMGWTDVALLCGQEMLVPDSLSMCLRVLIHWNTWRAPSEVHHVYLRGAKVLRPDWSERPLVRPVQMNALDAMARMLAQTK